VVVTDHHSPRADGALPDAPIVHPALCGYPCPDLCARGRRVQARRRAGRRRPADEDLDLVAWPRRRRGAACRARTAASSVRG
jgi:single-stranded-DNA-specific exonuclease